MRAVNLLPQDMRGAVRGPRPRAAAEAPGGSGPFWVLGALALCVVAMAAYVFAGNLVTEREAELARVTADQEAAAARAAALKPYGDFQDMAVSRRQTVSSLATLRFDWEQALRDVSQALPASVTLSALDGSITTETGANGGPLRGAIPAPAITLKGCTRNQGSVATMLSRLKAVRGVTRVSLSKSERVADSGSEEGPCGEGTPPQFEVVAFFERSGASAAPVGSTAATATPAAPAATPAATPTAPAAAAGAPATPAAASAGGAQSAAPAQNTPASSPTTTAP